MVPEDRIGRLEADVGELKSDLKALRAGVSESIVANAKEFGWIESGFASLRADMNESFESLRTSAKSLTASAKSLKRWAVVICIGQWIAIALDCFLGNAA